MGTRYEDQPAEHWAGAESLDPTPVWKQYVLIAALLFGGLIAVLVVSLLAILPQIVTPPALVPGDRLVLPIAELPPVSQPPRRIEPTREDTGRAFYLAHPSRDETLAFRLRWAPTVGGQECDVTILTLVSGGGFQFGYAANCERVYGRLYAFDARGVPRDDSYRGLDRYLVSVSDDRVIVNLSRLVRAPERTSAPVPTGIPQPQQP
ncbi:MAG TPA: hypothetical protein VGS01_12425 [Candidatus Limnocylindria bacterium]|jgi:hypothetical protein|nr:hypothetical protein [Candidatus Limnocylindria bacterium]